MKNLYQIAVIVATIGLISCQNFNDLDVDDTKKKIGEFIPEINELDTSNFNTSRLPKEEDVEKVLREKCKKNGAEDAVDTLKTQQEIVKVCLESYINHTAIYEELEEAKKTGSMDEVFGKYCRKWPLIYACFDNVTTTIRSCMDEKEVVAFNKSLQILDELQEFMCVKDGDRLAMFVAEGGVECVQERKEGVQECINSTLGSRIPDSDDFSITNLPTFLFSAKDCQDFDSLRDCVLTELEKCKDSTPANIVEAFFKFLKKHMPCTANGIQPKTASATLNNGAVTVNSIAASVVVSIALLLHMRF